MKRRQKDNHRAVSPGGRAFGLRVPVLVAVALTVVGGIGVAFDDESDSSAVKVGDPMLAQAHRQTPVVFHAFERNVASNWGRP